MTAPCSKPSFRVLRSKHNHTMKPVTKTQGYPPLSNHCVICVMERAKLFLPLNYNIALKALSMDVLHFKQRMDFSNENFDFSLTSLFRRIILHL